MSVPIWVGHYIGVPFKEHGREINGLDCWGLVRIVLLEQFSIVLPCYSNCYKSTKSVPELSKLIEVESKKWQEIELGNEKLGDVIVLRMRGAPMHVGLIIGDNSMLHVENYINSSIEKYKSSRWVNRIIGFYRYKEV